MRTDRAGVALGLDEGDVSCARKNEIARNPIISARTVFVMSSEVETSLTICPLQNIERFLDFARNDKLEKAPPVHMRKQIIAFFTLPEKFGIDILFLELLCQFLEA